MTYFWCVLCWYVSVLILTVCHCVYNRDLQNVSWIVWWQIGLTRFEYFSRCELYIYNSFLNFFSFDCQFAKYLLISWAQRSVKIKISYYQSDFCYLCSCRFLYLCEPTSWSECVCVCLWMFIIVDCLAGTIEFVN